MKTKSKAEKSTGECIGEHVKELMKYSKKDLAVMYANLHYVFNEITKSVKRHKK